MFVEKLCSSSTYIMSASMLLVIFFCPIFNPLQISMNLSATAFDREDKGDDIPHHFHEIGCVQLLTE